MEKFFYVVGRASEEDEIIDRLAERYGWTVKEIMDLDAAYLYRMDRKAIEGNKRKEAREQWIAMLPLMAEKRIEYMSFEAYYDQVSGKSIDTRPDEEILEEVYEIRKMMKEG